MKDYLEELLERLRLNEDPSDKLDILEHICVELKDRLASIRREPITPITGMREPEVVSPGATYLGAGLYVSFDGCQFRLEAPRGEEVHSVWLDPPVIQAFLEFVAKVRSNEKSVADGGSETSGE